MPVVSGWLALVRPVRAPVVPVVVGVPIARAVVVSLPVPESLYGDGRPGAALVIRRTGVRATICTRHLYLHLHVQPLAARHAPPTDRRRCDLAYHHPGSTTVTHRYRPVPRISRGTEMSSSASDDEDAPPQGAQGVLSARQALSALTAETLAIGGALWSAPKEFLPFKGPGQLVVLYLAIFALSAMIAFALARVNRRTKLRGAFCLGRCHIGPVLHTCRNRRAR